MPREIELKLALPATAHGDLLRHPLLAGAEALGCQALESVYFDTPDLALMRAGVGLRLRRQGAARVVTVKGEGSGAGGLWVRPEWEWPFEGEFDFTPVDDPRLRALLVGLLATGALRPAFETRFRRDIWRLQPAPQASLLVMLDRGTIAAAGRSESISEVELELERGPVETLFDVALALARDLPLLRPSSASKAERGYRLFQGRPLAPTPARPSTVGADEPTWGVFCRLAASCLEQIERNEVAGLDQPECVQQMCCALQRLRIALRVFAPALPAGLAARVRPPLQRLARVLDTLRGWDTLHSALARLPQAGAQHRALEARVRACRDQAQQLAADVLHGREHARFLLEFVAALQAPAAAAAIALPTFARRQRMRLRRRLARERRAARGADGASLRRVHVALAGLRFVTELLASPDGAGSARRAVDALAAAQRKLDRLHELSVAHHLLTSCVEDARLEGAAAKVQHALLESMAAGRGEARACLVRRA